MFGSEQTLEFTIMDRQRSKADILCGSCSIAMQQVGDGWSGWLELVRPKAVILKSGESMEEQAGKLLVNITWDLERVNALMKKPDERIWPDQDIFHLKEKDCWGHELLMLRNFKTILERSSTTLKYGLQLGDFRVVGATGRGATETIVCWKVSRQRFLDFTKRSGREKQFIQACRVSALEKQTSLKNLLERLIKKWEQEEQMTWLRSGAFMLKDQVEESMDPNRFKAIYKGVRAYIKVKNALNIGAGGWWAKMDPYAKVRFRGAKTEFRTSVLQDAGSDPVWDCEGSLTYQGEPALDISIWDYDQNQNDEQVALGVLTVEQYCNGGFEGMVPLSLPLGKKKKSTKPMFITIGIKWDMPRQFDASMTLGSSGTRTLSA
jgi:hypothetical protein